MRDLTSVGANDTYSNSLLSGTYRLIEWVRLYENAKVKRRNIAIVLCIFVGLAAFALGTAAGAKVVVPLIFAASATVGLLYLSTLTAPAGTGRVRLAGHRHDRAGLRPRAPSEVAAQTARPG